jgi:hypothetical protein
VVVVLLKEALDLGLVVRKMVRAHFDLYFGGKG